MQQDNKNNELQERQTYVPASVEVINFTAQSVLCGSGDIDGLNLRDDDTSNW